MNTAANPNFSSRYRYVILFLSCLVSFAINLATNLPTPLITTISSQMGWAATDVGKFVTLISLALGVVILINSSIIDRLGLKNATLIGLGSLVIGGLFPFIAGESYALHFLGRVFVGIGKGMVTTAPIVIIPRWFSPTQVPTMMGIRLATCYIAQAVPYYIVLPIYNLSMNWQITLGLFGILFLITFICFLFLYKEPKADTPKAAGASKASCLRQAARFKGVWMVAIGMVGNEWAYATFVVFMPVFLEYERGYSAAMASAQTSIISVACLFVVLFGGILSSMVGRRKLFTWPMQLLLVASIIGATVFDGFMLTLCMIGVAIGIGTFNLSFSTIPAELPGMTDDAYVGAQSIILCTAYLPIYFIPDIFALLQSTFSLSYAQLLMTAAVLPLIGAAVTFFLPETGPKAKKRAPADLQ